MRKDCRMTVETVKRFPWSFRNCNGHGCSHRDGISWGRRNRLWRFATHWIGNRRAEQQRETPREISTTMGHLSLDALSRFQAQRRKNRLRQSTYAYTIACDHRRLILGFKKGNCCERKKRQGKLISRCLWFLILWAVKFFYSRGLNISSCAFLCKTL